MEPWVTLRDARPDEAPAVEALWDAAYGSSSRSSAQDIDRLLSQGPNARLLVAEVDGVLAGTLIAAFDGWRGNMYRLAVHPDFQRQGIARQLVQAAHAWLQSIGCTRITALVDGDHDYATRFWESAGYEHDVATRRYHLDIGKRIASSGKARAMAGRKYGAIVQAKVKGAYFALSEQEQNIPGEVFGELMQKYAGKIDMVRRYWARAFNANVTDVLVFECDDPADFHAFVEDLTRGMAASGDPDRFGEDVSVTFGINPDAG